jgi:hypothetical protein
MFFFMNGGSSTFNFIIVVLVIYVLVKLSMRASYRGSSRRMGRRMGMFGPYFWRDLFGGPMNNNRYPYNRNNNNNYYAPNDPNNPYSNVPPTNTYNPYGNVPPTNTNNPNAYNPYTVPGNAYYTPPTGSNPTQQSPFSWPQATVDPNPPSATNSVRAWNMPNNQTVLKEAFVWVRSVAGWSYAGKLIVDGGMSSDEIKRYAQGKFMAADTNLVAIEAASLEDAKRIFESYHLF